VILDIMLSKTRFMYGHQCLRRLWWQVHEPDAPELVVSADLQALFDMGHQVGAAARDAIPGGVLVEHNRRSIGATRAALAAGATRIYEGAFAEGGVYVAVDILDREAGGWVLTEVKSATSAKDSYVLDAAVQAHVVELAGLPIARVEVMHLDPSYRLGAGGSLFHRADVTDRVTRLREGVPAEVERQLATLRGPLPEVPIGPHCMSPHDCPFWGRCAAYLPAGSVLELCGGRKRWDLLAAGVERIVDIPQELRGVPARQRRALEAGSVVVEGDLAADLARLESPIGALDFETLALALPVWEGCKPYEQMPAQWSLHVEQGTEWATASGSPRVRRTRGERARRHCSRPRRASEP
jgi:hypothetical protein